MKEIVKKTTALATGTLALLSLATAHASETSGNRMMDGWMHTSSHMTGYGMWGMGWYGALFGIALWILVILGIIYLYQKVTEERGDEE